MTPDVEQASAATSDTSAQQHTIASAFELEGPGLHEGRNARVRVKPGEPHSGFVFVRTDLPDQPKVAARVENICTAPRRTLLKQDNAEVHTTEHLLAGLWGCGVDNAIIELDGPEPPAGDGSAKIFAEQVMDAGVVAQDAARRTLRLTDTIAVGSGVSSMTASPCQHTEFEYLLDYGVPELPLQHATFSWAPDSFATEIAGARTFCLKSEADALRASGIGKGANTQNTLVVSAEGVVDNELRWSNEYARHKLLDVIGDLALAGIRVQGRFTCVRSGHTLNQEMAHRLQDAFEQQSLRRPSQLPGAMDHNAILRSAPHRYPFLMLDRVIEVRDEGRHVIGIKNVSFNEPFFNGHFPGRPVMPGVLQIEAMAQLAGITLISLPRYSNSIGLLTGVEKAKFKREVFPGDQLMLEARILKERRGVVIAECNCTVGGELASAATVRFMLVPKDHV